MPVAVRPLEKERRALLAVLLLLAAAGWAIVIWQAVGGDGGMHMGGDTDMPMETDMSMDMPMDMGMVADFEAVNLTMDMAAPLFLAMWMAMMVAMMLPASAPMILAFARSQSRRREEGGDAVPTWLFVAPYLAVWLGFGVLAYLAALLFDAVAGDTRTVADNISRVAGALFVAAGIYQLTPLKRVCLARCRTPLSFMLSYWRSGRWGAVTMGLRHGLFCLGCCWVLFVILLPLGVMNVAAMVAVAALVFAEKALRNGEVVARLAAAVLIAYGLLAIAVPDVLPTMV